MNKVNVIKIGGSSLATTSKITNLASILSKREEKLVIVVSAMGKTTDELINLGYSVNDRCNKRELDMLVATGEQVSATLMSMALHSFNKSAIALTGFQANIKTEGVHQKSTIKSIDISTVKDYLKEHDCVVVAGFQGINENNDVTTLGRGGSDTTAVALAAKLNCNCEIYTDVDGVYATDPRRYNAAAKLDNVSYEEMLELAISGSGVLEPRSVELALRYNVPVYVAQLNNNYDGTWIGR